MKNYINKIFVLFIVILFICLFIIHTWFFKKQNSFSQKTKQDLKTQEIITTEFDWNLNECFCDAFVFKISKKFSYILGMSYGELEKQFLQNYNVVYQNDNFVYDNQKKKILIKNITSFLNTKIFFAKSYLKISLGIYKIRDDIFINIGIYFKLRKHNNQYKLHSYFKIKSF
ncbi:hypothetical protein [Candidatus Phytoplasma fraxini]|uniref:Sequence-variable mosaic (SVM) signal sequence domain-containing protein n=1 Tax=Ash yellows phytoplasma TaxID=35780 RepID=A0ABZ2U9B1_ASHYP